jgi:hypothetical protein
MCSSAKLSATLWLICCVAIVACADRDEPNSSVASPLQSEAHLSVCGQGGRGQCATNESQASVATCCNCRFPPGRALGQCVADGSRGRGPCALHDSGAPDAMHDASTDSSDAPADGSGPTANASDGEPGYDAPDGSLDGSVPSSLVCAPSFASLSLNDVIARVDACDRAFSGAVLASPLDAEPPISMFEECVYQSIGCRPIDDGSGEDVSAVEGGAAAGATRGLSLAIATNVGAAAGAELQVVRTFDTVSCDGTADGIHRQCLIDCALTHSEARTACRDNYVTTSLTACLLSTGLTGPIGGGTCVVYTTQQLFSCVKSADLAYLANVRGCRRAPGWCPGSTQCCNGECHDPTCPAGRIWDVGSCSCACPGGLTDCGGSCVDTKTDKNNCGSCGSPCDYLGCADPGWSITKLECMAGVCVATSTPCPNGCVINAPACNP